MDLQPNKIDGIVKPITNTRISASEWNQLVGSCMAFITAAGFTPDADDNQQFLNAFIQIAQNIGAVGANVDLSNLSATGEAKFANPSLSNLSPAAQNVFYGRNFTPLNVTVAQGDVSIAGTYTLTNLPNDGVIRLALFECGLVTYANNYSCMALATDVSTTAGVVVGTNNFFTANTLALLPVKQTVTISFPSTAGAVVSPTGIKLLGYF